MTVEEFLNSKGKTQFGTFCEYKVLRENESTIPYVKIGWYLTIKPE